MSLEDIQKAIREAEANNDLPAMPEAGAATSAVGEGESLTVEFPAPDQTQESVVEPPPSPENLPSFGDMSAQAQTEEMVSLLRELKLAMTLRLDELVEVTRRGFGV